MGTTWSVRLVARPDADLATVRRAVMAELDDIVGAMSNWEAASAVSRFNAAPAGHWLTLPPTLFHVVRAGIALAGATDGAFDPTAGRLVDLWGFGPVPAPVLPPPAAALAEACDASGWRRLALDIHARRARQPGGLALDLSGIAKGYAVDRVAEVLAGMGHRHTLVEIGGELRGAGVRPDGQPWWVLVEPPPGAMLAPLRVALHGLAIATSGDYRRFFEQDGRRYAHSLDPRTGRPVANGIASVTVLHAEAMMADALATALTVLGRDAALAYADRETVAALIVTREGAGFAEHLSPAFAAMLD